MIALRTAVWSNKAKTNKQTNKQTNKIKPTPPPPNKKKKKPKNKNYNINYSKFNKNDRVLSKKSQLATLKTKQNKTKQRNTSWQINQVK